MKDKKTGKVKTIELEADLENDHSLLRFMALMQLASRFMTEEQMAEIISEHMKAPHGSN